MKFTWVLLTDLLSLMLALERAKPHANIMREVEAQVDHLGNARLNTEGLDGHEVNVVRKSSNGLSSQIAGHVKSVKVASEPLPPANASGVPSAGPWWLRYTPAIIMMGGVILSNLLRKASTGGQRSEERVGLTNGKTESEDTSEKKLRFLVPVVTVGSALAATFLVKWHLASPRTAICIVIISYILFKEMHRRLTGAPEPQEAPYSDSIDGAGRLALLDNIKFMAMCGVIAHHAITSFFVDEWVNPYLRATPLDRILCWLRFWFLPLFAFCAGMMTKGRFSRSNVVQLVAMWLIFDLFWYWMLNSGSSEEPDPVAPFLYDHDRDSRFFNPLRNYSAGGYLWWLQFMIVVPPLVASIRYLAGDSLAKMFALGHLTWIVLGYTSWKIENTGVFDKMPTEKYFWIYTFMFPGFLCFGIGTLVTSEHIMNMRKHPIARPLGAAVLLGYLLLWILADKDLVTSMVNQWNNPLYILFVVWPQSLITNAAFAACMPTGEYFFTRAGARSLYVYILHPIVIGLIESVYKDFNGNGIPHPPGADYLVTLAVMMGVVILNLILGSGAVERGIKPILMG